MYLFMENCELKMLDAPFLFLLSEQEIEPYQKAYKVSYLILSPQLY